MSKQLLLVWVVCLFAFETVAQKIATNTITFLQYGEDITKVIYTPKNYTRNELLSDAVILEPLAKVNSTLDEKRKIDIRNIEVELFDDSLSSGFIFPLKAGEAVYGGGERALPLDRRGYSFNLHNNPWYGYSEGADNLNFSVPFFMNPKAGYGLYFDNPSTGRVDIGKTNANQFLAAFTSGEINVFIIPGNTQKEILDKFYKLTGTQPLPPKWALGNFMSRFGYTSTEQANTILKKMQQEKIPVDAIIFDLFWFGDSIKGTMGNLDWVNKQKWPNPSKMISDYSKQNINTILITEPFVLQSSKTYDESKNFHATDATGAPFVLQDFYFGKGGIIDIFRKDAQDWFWSKHVPQMKRGVEAWWGDLGEPEKHPQGLFHNLADYGFKRKFEANEVHNIYGHTWTKMLYNKYAKHYPEKRLFSLNRSGFAGSQRFGIFPWSGDVSRSWSGLRAQLPLMLGMSMSGIPYIHADAGGFAGGEGDNELYVRWLQFASFTPIFRPHGTALYEMEKAAFSFPSEPALIDTPYRKFAKKYIDLRYQLLPYNYTLAYKQTTKGEPLVAPLAYWFANDSVLANVSDQFMWGENILVAPILQKGATKRAVVFPNETKWYELGTNNTIETGIENKPFVFEASISEMPIFAKAGSFLAMDSSSQFKNTKDITTKHLDLHYYFSDKPSIQEVFADDGQSKSSLKEKHYELLEFSATGNQTKTITLSKKINNNYKGKPASRTIRLFLHNNKNIASVRQNGKSLKVQNQNGISYVSLAWKTNSTLKILVHPNE